MKVKLKYISVLLQESALFNSIATKIIAIKCLGYLASSHTHVRIISAPEPGQGPGSLQPS